MLHIVIPKTLKHDLPERAASTYTGCSEQQQTSVLATANLRKFEFSEKTDSRKIKNDEKNYFECPTCDRVFNVENVPKLIECGESVCQACIVEMVKGLAEGANEFYCKICGDCHVLNEFRVFKNNKFLLKLVKLADFNVILKDVISKKEEAPQIIDR